MPGEAQGHASSFTDAVSALNRSSSLLFTGVPPQPQLPVQSFPVGMIWQSPSPTHEVS